MTCHHNMSQNHLTSVRGRFKMEFKKMGSGEERGYKCLRYFYRFAIKQFCCLFPDDYTTHQICMKWLLRKESMVSFFLGGGGIFYIYYICYHLVVNSFIKTKETIIKTNVSYLIFFSFKWRLTVYHNN